MSPVKKGGYKGGWGFSTSQTCGAGEATTDEYDVVKDILAPKLIVRQA